jgi:tetratricopeptide (TPR) repeat protein
MMRRPVFIASIAAACALLTVAVALQMLRDRVYARDDQQRLSVLYVRSGPALGRIALEYDALAADVYWIRAIQYYGGMRLAETDQSEKKYQLLYPLLDIATSLDPFFTIAYRFGAIFLSEGYPGGPGRPDQAITLLRKGIASQPTKWQYYHDIAFVYYWQLHDMETAARWFRLAASQPGAPNWLEPVAATMLIQGGDRASARFLLRQILMSEEAWLRRMASRGLLQVDALDVIDQLQTIVRRFPPPPGTPYSWDWLMQQRVLAMVPPDPTGTPFHVDPQTGTVTISTNSELYPLPTRKQ